MKILVVDIGGTHIKFAATGHKTKQEFESGPAMTPQKMVAQLKQATAEWDYEAVSIGYPGPVVHNKIIADPAHLAPGWAGFHFRRAFKRPVRIINDAAMQALGSYRRGRMLFLGLGTGLGSAFVVDGVVEPMELAHLPYKKGKTYEDYAGLAGLKRAGKKKWRRHVADIASRLKIALQADYVVLGGGNARLIKDLPPGCELGDNDNAFRGGFRLWKTGK